MNLIEATKNNFRVFCQWVGGKDFEIANHHEKIIQNLQDVFDGKTTRLIINVPP
jgi:hypothetical protein